MIVAGAARDDGSGHLTERAVEGLRLLGVVGDLRGHARAAHAFVGVKGAPSGSAAEKLGPGPVKVTIGAPSEELGLELTEFEMLRSSAPSTR